MKFPLSKFLSVSDPPQKPQEEKFVTLDGSKVLCQEQESNLDRPLEMSHSMNNGPSKGLLTSVLRSNINCREGFIQLFTGHWEQWINFNTMWKFNKYIALWWNFNSHMFNRMSWGKELWFFLNKNLNERINEWHKRPPTQQPLMRWNSNVAAEAPRYPASQSRPPPPRGRVVTPANPLTAFILLRPCLCPSPCAPPPVTAGQSPPPAPA